MLPRLSMDYEAVIGLETHVQLKTRTKMWCGCPNTFGAEPNSSVCPVCLGLPGAMPAPNEEALRLTILAGLVLGCTIPPRAKFDRKNYFYPDSAKNYQITQYDQPSTREGRFEFEFDGPGSADGVATIRITRAHLEEDVGKSTHFDRNSGVDFNRAGVPLLEIVSEPELNGPDMAYAYLRALTQALDRAGVSDCDLEKGMVRCDVNVSVRPVGATKLGAKIEIKNMNSFSGVRRALEYEIPRQIEAVRRGEALRQETRRWDDEAGVTEPMRSKEDAHDYRYFPEPDLMPMAPTPEWLAEVRSRLPELPLARKRRFVAAYKLPAGDAEVFRDNVPLGDFFEAAAAGVSNPKPVANLVINNVQALLSAAGARVADLRFGPADLAELVRQVEGGGISSKSGQEVLAEMFESGAKPAEIIARRGLSQVSDSGALDKWCDEVIAANPGPAADFRAGKAAALNFLKGQVMKLSKGQANPKLVGETLERRLRA
jgi:aspartyl-tRNA(Asn)/glutamyl-tRNA(Gln) amidotransferase subunit B